MSGQHNAGSRDLPPYRAILVVDAKSFSDRPSVQQSELSARIERVLHAAFVRAGLADAWVERRFAAHTGDGYIVGLLPERLPHLVHPLLRDLQDELQEEDHRRSSREPRLRLRASIHVGPVPDRGLANDGVGKPMTDTHRLLDSDQVRRCLAETHEDVTFLAAIVSQRAYADAVEGGYTGLHPAQFIEVEASAKQFAERAFLHVPQVSGRLLHTGMAERGPLALPDRTPPLELPEPARTVREIGDQLVRGTGRGDRLEAQLAGRESTVVWVDSAITFNAPTTIAGDLVAGGQSKSSAIVAASSRSRTTAGGVSAEHLRKVRFVFQPPAAYAPALDALREHRLALLCGPAGVGKRTAALYLLSVDAHDVQEIDPAVDANGLLTFPFEPGRRYVLHADGPRGLARFAPLPAAQLDELLERQDAWLVVTVDDPAGLGARAPHVVPFEQGPDSRAVLLRHLDWYLAGAEARVDPAGLCEQPRIRDLLDAVRSPAELDRLARVLLPVVRDGAELVPSLTRFDTIAMHEVEEWFRARRNELGDCALLIATSVLNGASHHAVAAAADDLHDRLWAREHPGEDGPRRAIFDLSRAERLEAVEARTSGGYQHTSFGSSPVDVVTLANPSWQPAVLRHVWREYDLGRQCLVQWLRDLGRHPQSDVRVRVATAVGELAGREFAHVCAEILEPWGHDDREEVREAAAIALGIAAHGDDSSLVRNLLSEWAQGPDRRSQWTAATAFGGRAGLRFPNLSLERLEAIVEAVTGPGLAVLTDQEVELLAAAGSSVRRLFEHGQELPEYHREVLRALVRWTDRRRPPAMVIVAEFIFLHLAMRSLIQLPGEPREWPAVLWLMEQDERAHELAEMLWKRSFLLPETKREAVHVLEAWGRLTRDRPGRAGSLERLAVSLSRTGS
jgi:hypothetical protein